MVQRAINKKIILKAKQQEGKNLNVVATDKALALCLGVNVNTIAHWRKGGVIPYKIIPGTKTPIYKIKAVIRALEHYEPTDIEGADKRKNKK